MADKPKEENNKKLVIGAPAGIWTRVAGSKGRHTWPDYTTGAHRTDWYSNVSGLIKIAFKKERIGKFILRLRRPAFRLGHLDHLLVL